MKRRGDDFGHDALVCKHRTVFVHEVCVMVYKVRGDGGVVVEMCRWTVPKRVSKLCF